MLLLYRSSPALQDSWVWGHSSCSSQYSWSWSAQVQSKISLMATLLILGLLCTPLLCSLTTHSHGVCPVLSKFVAGRKDSSVEFLVFWGCYKGHQVFETEQAADTQYLPEKFTVCFFSSHSDNHSDKYLATFIQAYSWTQNTPWKLPANFARSE